MFCVRREGFIEIRSTQPIVLASDSWKSVAASGSFLAVRRLIVERRGIGFKECLSDGCLVGASCLEWKAGIDNSRLPAIKLGFR